MSYEEIQSNIKKIEDEIEAVKTEKKNAQEEIKEIKESLKANDLDKETREIYEQRLTYYLSQAASLQASFAALQKRLDRCEQSEWELTNKSLQTDNNISPNSLKKLEKKMEEAKYYKSKSDELVTQNEAELRLWTRYYFNRIYVPKGLLVVSIKYEKKPKQLGDQLSQRATIQYKIENENRFIKTLYHLKTHERGHSLNNKYARLVDPRELLVYKFFDLIGLGPPERHFYYNIVSRENFYIASKDIDQSLTNQSWRTFDFDSNEESFINSFESDNNYMKCLIYMELISKILYLNDVNNNLSNFGLITPVLSYKDIRIIDFYVYDIFLKEDMLGRFERPDISLTNKKYLDKESQFFFTVDLETKKSMANYILTDILNCDKDFFKRNFNDAIEKTNSFMGEYGNGLISGNKEEFEQNQKNYQDYIEKVNLNFEKFIKRYVY